MNFVKGAAFSIAMTLVAMALINRVGFLRKVAATDAPPPPKAA